MEKGNEKRVLRVELDDDVKKVSITGLGSDEKVVMKQELSEDELDMVTGGLGRQGEEICTDQHTIVGGEVGDEFDFQEISACGGKCQYVQFRGRCGLYINRYNN